MKERILDINPKASIEIHKCFYLPENEDEFNFSEYDYIVDAVDTVTAKISIIVNAKKNNIPIISSMGTGNKINPSMLEVSDIYKTSVDPLARVMRLELKKRHVNKLKVVYSKEIPLKPLEEMKNEKTNKVTPGSTSFVPSAAGLLIASEVIKDITNIKNDNKGA